MKLTFFVFNCRVPTVLENSLNFGFSLKSPWKWICSWKVEFMGPSLKFQFVVLDFLFCVFWTESLNGYSKLRGTRANFSQKNSARTAYKLNIFSSPGQMFGELLSYPGMRMHKHFNLAYNSWTTIDRAFIFHMCIPCDKTFPWVPRIEGFCTNSKKKKFPQTPPPPPLQAELF